MTGAGQRVAIITGGSQGIGADLVAACQRRDWAVVANSRTIKPSEDEAVLTISGDISKPATTDRIIRSAVVSCSRPGRTSEVQIGQPSGTVMTRTLPP
jgi:NAD(P)-dependent dehydrogenase (short-subunit alcohol dehydrogenase family)